MIETNEYIEELLLDVDAAVANNEPKEAKRILEEILLSEPAYSIAHNYLGWLYLYYFRNYKMAESHLRMAIKFKPAYPPAFQHLGTLKVMNEEYEEGEKILRQGLEYKGINHVAVYEELGKLYELKGKYWLARRHYKLAIKNCMDNEQLEHLKKHLRRCRFKLLMF